LEGGGSGGVSGTGRDVGGGGLARAVRRGMAGTAEGIVWQSG